MNYLTVKEAAKKLHVSERRVQYYCANGLIPNCSNIGKQWLIPLDATLPRDRRCRDSENAPKSARYHFPILVYSELYPNAAMLLNDDERKLLSLQENHFRGHYEANVKSSLALLAQTNETYLRAGLLATLAYASLVLGASSEFDFAYKALKRIAESGGPHQEDYKLIFYALNYHVNWQENLLSALEVRKLSEEALLYFAHVKALKYVLTNEPYHEFYVSALESYAAFAKERGMPVLSISMNLLLSSIAYRNKETDKGDAYLEEAVETVAGNGMIGELAKYYWLVSDSLEKCIQEKYPHRFPLLQEYAKSNYKAYERISQERGRKPRLVTVPLEQSEIGLLLADGFSDAKIASILRRPKKDVCRIVEEVRKQNGYDSRQALIADLEKDYLSR